MPYSFSIAEATRMARLAEAHHNSVGVPLFPCEADKAPAIKWGDVAIDEPEATEKFFESHRVAPLWGMPTGARSGINVLDFDFAEIPDDIHETVPYTPWKVRTKKGWHLYYRASVSLKNDTNAASKIDVRSDGGYAVAIGEHYEHHIDPSWSVDIADLPVLTAEHVRAVRARFGAKEGNRQEPQEADKALIAAMVDGRIEPGMGVKKGGRNHALNSYAFQLALTDISKSEFDQKIDTFCLNADYNERDEIARTVESAFNAGIRERAARGAAGASAAAPSAEAGAAVGAEEADSLFETQDWSFDTEVRPRKWIYRRRYLKGYVAGTAATGGTGKTSLLDVESASLALGVDLLDPDRPALRAGSQRVLMLSLEDTAEEFYRRQKAVADYYELSDAEKRQIERNVTPIFQPAPQSLSEKTADLKLVIQRDREAFLNYPVIDALIRKIQSGGYSVLTVDPLIGAHDAEENSNPQMNLVLRSLRHIARVCDVAVHYSHHNRKGGSSEADDMRGAVALRDGSRVLDMIGRMTEQDRDVFGISEASRPYFVFLVNGKANFAVPSAQKRWMRLQTVVLDNEEEFYEADAIGVVAHVDLEPEVAGGLDDIDLHRFAIAMRAAGPEEMRSSEQAEGWAGYLLSGYMGLDIGTKGVPLSDEQKTNKAKVRSALKAMVSGGLLRKTEVKDSARVSRPCFAVCITSELGGDAE